MAPHLLSLFVIAGEQTLVTRFRIEPNVIRTIANTELVRGFSWGEVVCEYDIG